MALIVFAALLICDILISVGLYSRHRISANRAFALIVSLPLFAVIVSVTMDAMLPTYAYRVTVEASGEQSSEAQGYDIGIAAIRCGGKDLDLSGKDIINSTWIYSGSSLCWGYTESQSIEFLVPCYFSTQITFNSNIWAGKVRITAQDTTEVIDLYAWNETTTTYTIAHKPFYGIAKELWLVSLVILLELGLTMWLCWKLPVRLPLKFLPQRSKKQALFYNLLNLPSQRPYTFLRVVIVVISFLTMRAFAGELSLWADDLATIQFVAEGETLQTVIERVLDEARYNPPLYYVFAYIWLRIAPYGTVYIKLLNIFICCAGIWLCGAAAKRIQGERAAVIATIFAATSSFLINYAAYTFRSFALMFLLCVLVIIAYQKRLTEPEKVRNLVIYGALHALLLYTNYICILITASMGLYDLWLFARKKLRFNFILSYLGAGLAFFPLILFVFSDLVESHSNFWPAVPALGNLLGIISLIFSDKIFILLFFAIASIVVFLVPAHRDEASVPSKASAQKDTIMALVLWVVFIVGFVYVFSRYIYPAGSIFVERYFIAVVAPALIAAAVGMDWIITALIDRKSPQYAKILVAAAIVACYCTTQYNCLIKLNAFPGTMNSPYEQAIDWIYSNKESQSGNMLVVMTVGKYVDGLYYYGTHGGQRPNLNFGYLDDSNWQSYDEVFVSPMHGEIPPDTQWILDEHFGEFIRNDSLNVIGYRRIQE